MKSFLNWSSGKDAALALHYLQQSNEYNVEHLLTTVNEKTNRVSMQGVRKNLLEVQIASVNLPCTILELPDQPKMDVYEKIINMELDILKDKGFTVGAYGDIFLEDIRRYREQQLSKKGIDAVFPLWKKDTKDLIHEFIDLGFKAIVTVVQEDKLSAEFLGMEVDTEFLKRLPADIDPCGENGEFHTFCYDGPVFDHPIDIETGENFYKEYNAPGSNNKDVLGYWFCDLQIAE